MLTVFKNPKYLESANDAKCHACLKDTSKVEDKATKRALALMNEYLTWEKRKKTLKTKEKKKENKAA